MLKIRNFLVRIDSISGIQRVSANNWTLYVNGYSITGLLRSELDELFEILQIQKII